MRRTTPLLVTASLLALLAAAGCSFLRPRSDPSRFFVLVPTAEPPADGRPVAARDVSFGIGPISLPDYLKRPTIVTRTGPTQIEPSPFDRWGEPIDKAVPRVLQEDLRRLLATDRVVLFPWYSTDRPTYQVEVDVLRFERDPENRATLAARWEIRGTAAGKLLRAGETRVTRDAAGPGPAEGVAAESAALGDLARDVAAALGAVVAQPR